jgi:hypothetical protein
MPRKRASEGGRPLPPDHERSEGESYPGPAPEPEPETPHGTRTTPAGEPAPDREPGQEGRAGHSG